MEKTLLLIVSMLLMAAGTVAAKDMFIISHWFGPSETTKEKFKEATDANFNVILSQGDVKTNQKAIELCQELGVKAMVYDPRFIEKDEKDPGFKENLDSMIEAYGKYPALWAYCVADEPNSSQFPKLAAVNKYLLSKDPKRIPFINLFPTYANTEQLGNPTYEKHVDEYMRIVQPKVLSYDHYAIMKDGHNRPDYFENLEIIRNMALKYKTPFFNCPLSLGHGPYSDPTDAEIRWQINTSLVYGARGIVYFTYSTFAHDETWNWGEALIRMDGSRTRKYEEVKLINAELLKLAPTLMKLKSVAVYHTGELPSGTKALPTDGLICKIEGGEFVIGQFNSTDGGKYAMFVNKSLKNPELAKIAFSQKVSLYEVSRATGKQTAVFPSDRPCSTKWTTVFQPGEAKLVRIDSPGGISVMRW